MGIQVRPFKDEYREERLKILGALGSIDDKIRLRDSKEYTTVLTESEDVQEISNLEEILEAMNKLYKKLQPMFTKIENTLKSIWLLKLYLTFTFRNDFA